MVGVTSLELIKFLLILNEEKGGISMEISSHNMNTYGEQDLNKSLYYPAGCCSCSCSCPSAASIDVNEE